MVRRFNNPQCSAANFPSECESFRQSSFSESIVDKSAFRPDMPDVVRAASTATAVRHPVYDYVGTSPHDIDSLINVAWIRSKARDRTEIDAALDFVKNNIADTQKTDNEKLTQQVKEKANIDSLKEVISDAVKASKTSDSTSSSPQ